MNRRKILKRMWKRNLIFQAVIFAAGILLEGILMGLMREKSFFIPYIVMMITVLILMLFSLVKLIPLILDIRDAVNERYITADAVVVKLYQSNTIRDRKIYITPELRLLDGTSVTLVLWDVLPAVGQNCRIMYLKHSLLAVKITDTELSE